MRSMDIKTQVEIFTFRIIILLILYINDLAIKSIQPKDISFIRVHQLAKKLLFKNRIPKRFIKKIFNNF
ncbi:hypothetical protein D9M71_16310 [compost metagenome]